MRLSTEGRSPSDLREQVSGTSAERHEWLEKARKYCTSLLAKVDCTVPANTRVTIGFPSTGGRGKTIGQCVYDEGVSDQFHEVFVSPVLGDSVTILATLIHELIHAANPKAKHGKDFKKPALAVGLTGKMTATVAGDELAAKFAAWVEKVGPYPAGSISLVGRKKQTTRLLKAECETCGYVVRVTAKWVTEVGPPHCPDHGAMAVEGVSEENPEDIPDDEPGTEVEPEAPEDPEAEFDNPVEPEPDDEPEVVSDDEEGLRGYRVVQEDPDHDRKEWFEEDQRAAAEAKARQWSKTGKERTALVRAITDEGVVGYKVFHGGLASPSTIGEYPL